MIKKLLTLLLTCATCFLSACENTPQQRGVSGKAYYSSTRPAIKVEAGEMPVITFGQGHGRLDKGTGNTGKSLDVQTCVWGTDDKSPMAILIHAELPGSGLHWAGTQARPGSVQAETEHFNEQEWSAYTYLVPGRTDPFAGLAGEEIITKGDASYWLARCYTRRFNGNESKVILEYREPAPAGLRYLSGMTEQQEAQVKAFRDRARTVFILEKPEKPLPEITKGFAKNIRWQYMRDDVLGTMIMRN